MRQGNGRDGTEWRTGRWDPLILAWRKYKAVVRDSNDLWRYCFSSDSIWATMMSSISGWNPTLAYRIWPF